MSIAPKLARAAERVRPSVFAELQSRIDAHAKAGGSLIPLQIGDTYLTPPAQALLSLAAHGDDAELYRYGATAALANLREAIAERARVGLGRVDAASEVLVGAGATHALACALRSVLDEGDEVVLPTPYWPLAPGVIEGAGGRVIEVLLHDRATLPERIAEVIGARTRVIYLITPNNPDGAVLPADVVSRIIALAAARGLWIVADEVYADYTYEAPHIPIASLPGARERTITAGSFSKSHALAGARVGWVIAPPTLTTSARRMSVHTLFNVPVVAQRSALAATRTGDDWIAEAKRAYQAARALTLETLSPLQRRGVRWTHPQGGSYVFLELAGLLDGRPLLPLLESMIDRGVLLSPGSASGQAHGDAARLCFTAVPEPQLREGLARVVDAIERFA